MFQSRDGPVWILELTEGVLCRYQQDVPGRLGEGTATLARNKAVAVVNALRKINSGCKHVITPSKYLFLTGQEAATC